MPEIRLQFRPGIDLEKSPTAQRGGWSASNLIRWRDGLPEKLGGWVHFCATPLTGVCRTLHYWSDLSGVPWLAAGTHNSLFVEYEGALYDITPAGFVPMTVSSEDGPFSLGIWSLDNFGEDLIAIPYGRGVFLWTPPPAAQEPPAFDLAPATQISEAPAICRGGFVAMPQQIIMVYGCTPLGGGAPDPMLIRWCDEGDETDWTASSENQAGSFRLPRGNLIVGAIQAPLVALFWTDFDVWIAQYIGFPLVFGFTQLYANCGLIAQNARAILGGEVYWMSDHGFFVYNGAGVAQIPCPVWDFVFRDIDENNSDKCIAAANFHFSEIGFFFPSLSGGTGEIDSYVKYNVAEKSWDVGRLARTAWTDENRPGPPFAVDPGSNLIMQHDAEGVFDADGAPMTGVSLRSGYQDLRDGTDIAFVDRLIPDFLWDGPTPSLTMSLYFRNWPGDTSQVQGPFTITPSTEYVSLRVRAREMAVEIDCSAALGSWFRLGVPRLRVAADGRL